MVKRTTHACVAPNLKSSVPEERESWRALMAEAAVKQWHSRRGAHPLTYEIEKRPENSEVMQCGKLEHQRRVNIDESVEANVTKLQSCIPQREGDKSMIFINLC